MDLIQAIIMGVVQGLTEFIPISSTAHLVFASRFTGIYAGDPEMVTATMAVIQLGTLAAVLLYFFADIWGITTAFVRDHWNFVFNKRKMRFSGTDGTRPIFLSEEAWLGWLIILGSIPIGTLGLIFKDVIEGPGTKNLWVIAIMLIVIALGLWAAEIVSVQRKDIRHLGLGDAIVQGFCQVLALMPGASRSGSTIMGGLLIGERRETAARFSFLLSIPAITASGLLELRKALKILPETSLVPLLVGTLVSAVVGYAAIWFLLNYLKKHSTQVFIIYRLLLGAIILILLYLGVISPVVN
ncbi:MAG: undecaprenyl-diphosphatase UppP [Chloracidobacterium sp.]|nr:undecaprenyl-diphosphatase UppP [Chloracidobacterium sp.]MCC6824327.1 undecaprenyl-diphosphatase UppP [Acidobacteriota bacterium]MCO5332598.1 undecaprenyl-diphosphatase UppP [Pyrinomonadaceae bacterium]